MTTSWNQRDERVELTAAVSPISVLAPPFAISALTWFTAANAISLPAFLASYLILQCAWASYLQWSKRPKGLPVFAMMASVYWVFFAVALFWGERRIFTGHFVPVGEEFVTQAVLMALLGVACLGAGMSIPLPQPAIQNLPDIDTRASSSWVYLRAVLIVTTALRFYTPSVYLLGAGGRNVMTILVTTIPTVAFLLLLRKRWLGGASPVDEVLLIVIAVVHLVGGLASGWLGSIVSFGLTLAAFYVVIRGKVPWTAIVLTVAAIFFLQVGKNEFRAIYWNTDASGDTLERAKFWLDASASHWLDSLQAGAETRSSQLASTTVERASLLTQVAHVLELTPSQVPYQQGGTYSYLAVALIPRFLWPDKPTVSIANQYYQVAYGLTDQRQLDSVSIAIGSMGEGYINFGWFGVVCVMLGIGMALGLYAGLCTADLSNTLVLAILVALLPQLLTIESQLGQYTAGILQQIVLTFVVFLPITLRKSRSLRANARAINMVPVRVRRATSL